MNDSDLFLEEEEHPRRESKPFDKIIKENLSSFILGFSEYFLGISLESSKAFLPDLQTTIGREPDFIRWVKGDSDFILHIEFQSVDDEEMVYRMAEYKAILLRKYRVPVRQYVIYLGLGKSKMTVSLPKEQEINSYSLLNFNDFRYDAFLNANDPETVIMTILSDFNGEDPNRITELVVHRLKEVCRSTGELKKYLTQLNVMSKLHNLDQLVYQKIQNMPIIFDPTDHILFKKGEEKGMEIGLKAGEDLRREEQERLKEEFVQKLLARDTFDLSEIADIANVSIEFVEGIKRKVDRLNK